MKEYLNRWNRPLVNPPITYGEYEANRFKEGLRKCAECDNILDTGQIDIRVCFGCYAENFRPKNRTSS